MIDVNEYIERLDFLADWVGICAQRKINLLREMNFILETGWVLGFHYYPNAKTFDEYVEQQRVIKRLLNDPNNPSPLMDQYWIPKEPFHQKKKPA